MLNRLNATPAYRALFGKPEKINGLTGGNRAIAEFELTLIFADAPIDQFARGHRNKLAADQKKGALISFGKGSCVDCLRCNFNLRPLGPG